MCEIDKIVESWSPAANNSQAVSQFVEAPSAWHFQRLSALFSLLTVMPILSSSVNTFLYTAESKPSILGPWLHLQMPPCQLKIMRCAGSFVRPHHIQLPTHCNPFLPTLLSRVATRARNTHKSIFQGSAECTHWSPRREISALPFPRGADLKLDESFRSWDLWICWLLRLKLHKSSLWRCNWLKCMKGNHKPPLQCPESKYRLQGFNAQDIHRLLPYGWIRWWRLGICSEYQWHEWNVGWRGE